MKTELRYIGEKIVEHSSDLAKRFGDKIDSNHTLNMSEFGISAHDIQTNRIKLLTYLGQALYQDEGLIRDQVIEWGEKVSKLGVKYNIPMSKLLRALSLFKTVIWDIFTEELRERRFSAITMIDVSKMIDPLLDKVSEVISEIYENRSNELMKVAYSALDELSVPVVPIIEGIGVIPLIGIIDTNRAQLIMETALHEGKRHHLNSIILDVSGVPIIDTMVANQLFKIISAVELIGMEVVISGIRPEIAQTMVNLGLNFSKVNTQSSLQKALKQLGLKIEKL